MKIGKVNKSILEAKRFLASANVLIALLNDHDYEANICGSKESGAARRASMDLTRALADMRRL